MASARHGFSFYVCVCAYFMGRMQWNGRGHSSCVISFFFMAFCFLNMPQNFRMECFCLVLAMGSGH